MTDSIAWMEIFFQPEVNPYANVVTLVVPPRRRIGERGPRAPSIPALLLEDQLDDYVFDSKDQDEWSGRMKQVEAAAPLLPRARPTMYYLAPEGGLSLLWYEYDTPQFHFQITESSAALLVRFRPRGPFDIRQGISQKDANRMLHAVLNLENLGERHWFYLPRVLKTGRVFSDSGDASYPAAIKENDPLPHWAGDIVGFASDRDICLILRKCEIVLGSPTPYHTHWQEPHPDWLRKDLFESNGFALVIERGKSSKRDRPPQPANLK